MARRYQEIIEALEHRINVQTMCITDAETDKDYHNAALLKVRRNEARTIRSCLTTGRLDHL